MSIYVCINFSMIEIFISDNPRFVHLWITIRWLLKEEDRIWQTIDVSVGNLLEICERYGLLIYSTIYTDLVQRLYGKPLSSEMFSTLTKGADPCLLSREDSIVMASISGQLAWRNPCNRVSGLMWHTCNINVY